MHVVSCPTTTSKRPRGVVGCLLLIVTVVLAGNDFASAQGQQGGSVRITISDELVLAPDDSRQGQLQRDTAGNLVTRPGDIIRYTLTATNGGAESAHEVEIVDPIPEGTEYLAESAKGSEMTITYSIDGGHYFQPTPIMEDFRKPDGTLVRRPVPLARYTHIKWRVDNPIPEGLSVSATVTVKVTPTETLEGVGN
jgi:uncharacterized repeat protein (TIGR01451 family)